MVFRLFVMVPEITDHVNIGTLLNVYESTHHPIGVQVVAPGEEVVPSRQTAHCGAPA